jgi:hypothetical protein
VIPLAGQPGRNLVITTLAEVPAGADVADPVEIAAAISAHTAMLASGAVGMYDTILTSAV